MMKEIQLTQGQVTLVDDGDFEWLSQWIWHAEWKPSTQSFMARRSEGRNHIRMHRVIMNAPMYLLVDHKNHNTLDNQRRNLRLCTNANNGMNQRKQKGTSSQYKGVSWSKDKQKWLAYIKYNQKRIYLGYFVDEKSAGLAYDVAAKQLFGEFALCNFI